MEISLRTVDSPVGPITLGASSSHLLLCATGECASELLRELESREVAVSENISPEAVELLNRAERALELYFNGEFSALSSVPLKLSGTDFQKSVWTEMLHIRGGDLASYKALAEAINNSGAVRAVGLACRVNPLHLFVPCHRIVASDGDLSGFRGGLEVKKWLLNFEFEVSREEQQLDLLADSAA